MENLWPDFSDVAEIATPKKILEEQAINLEKGTKNLLKAEVSEARASTWDLAYQFKIIAPFVGDYSVTILRIEHSIYLYPVAIYFSLTGQRFENISEEEFPNVLKEIFNNDKTQNVVRNLIGQSISLNTTKG